MSRRTRWIRWARENAPMRRRQCATAHVRRAFPKGDIRRWLIRKAFPGPLYFQGKKPNPFRGKNYPYAAKDGYLRNFLITSLTE